MQNFTKKAYVIWVLFIVGRHVSVNILFIQNNTTTTMSKMCKYISNSKRKYVA